MWACCRHLESRADAENVIRIYGGKASIHGDSQEVMFAKIEEDELQESGISPCLVSAHDKRPAKDIDRTEEKITNGGCHCRKVQAMEKNQKKGHNRKGFHLKKHKKADPRPTNKAVNDEKPVLFQLGSIAMVSDARLKADPEITNSIPASPSSLSSSSSSGNNNAKERKLSELQSSSNTLGSQVSGVTHASSMEPALLSSPSVQLMDREGSSDQSQRNSLPILERNLSTVSNDSLFSLSIGGDNTITRDELFSYRDFKAGEVLKSSELLSFCPSVPVPVDSSDIGKSFDLEDKASDLLGSDSDDKSSNLEVSWRNLGDNSDEAPSSTQSNKKEQEEKEGEEKECTTAEEEMFLVVLQGRWTVLLLLPMAKL
ncbi:hypothetical protein Bca4012_057371 [Brassica carinata]